MFKVYLRVFLLLSIMILLLIGSGCQEMAGASDDDDDAPRVVYTDEMLAFLEDSSDDTTVNDSGMLIETARLAGDITLSEAIALKYDAWQSTSSLPAAYQSDEPFVWRTMQRDRQWILKNYATLSVADQVKYAGFILPPDDAASDFYPTPSSSASSRSGIVYEFKTIDFVHEGRTKAIVYYFEPEDQTTIQATKAQWVKKALEDSWGDFKTLFGVEPTITIPFYVIDLQDDMGITNGWSDGRCEVDIEDSMNEKNTKATTVHELFHCFQYQVNFEDGDDQYWLGEATAVWSEDFIYPSYNTEHEYLRRTFNNLDKDRIRFDGRWEYSNYLFFFFATKYLNDNTIIPKMIKDAVTLGVWNAIRMNVPDIVELYAEYAKYNINAWEWKLYKDTPAFSTRIPGGSCRTEYDFVDVLDAEDETIFNTIGKGGITYDVFNFGESLGNIHKVEFDFTGIPGDRHIQIQAFYNVDGEWFEQDWTDVTKPSFCRTSEAERVVMLMLVIANPDLTTGYDISYDINLEDDCTTPGGYVNVRESISGDGYSYELTYRQSDVLVYDNASNSYLLVKSTKEYSFQSTTTATILPGTPPCTQTISSTGTLDYEYPSNERDVRLDVNRDGLVDWLGMRADDYDPTDWVTEVSSGSCFGTSTDTTTPSLFMTSIDILPSDYTATGITGTRSYDLGSTHVEIEFCYTGLR